MLLVVLLERDGLPAYAGLTNRVKVVNLTEIDWQDWLNDGGFHPKSTTLFLGDFICNCNHRRYPKRSKKKKKGSGYLSLGKLHRHPVPESISDVI